MKKYFFLLVALMTTLSVFAGSDKKWNFTINNDDECVVNRIFSTTKDTQDALKSVKKAINRQSFESRNTLSEDAESIVFQLRKNTKVRYNPFAGNFNESVQFKMRVSVSGSQVNVLISDLTLETSYTGYGQKQNSDTFVELIGDYQDAEVTAKSSKGKEKKNALEKMEDINDSLNMCQEELDKILGQLEKELK